MKFLINTLVHFTIATFCFSSFLFICEGSVWAQHSEVGKLFASDGAGDDRFGYTLSMDGDVAIIGAVGDDDNGSFSGSAYIFRWNGSSWVQEQKLTASDGAEEDWFGIGVTIKGNLAVVGANYGDGNVADSGAAYVYRWNGSIWVEEQKLIASDGGLSDRFGFKSIIKEDMILIGSYYHNSHRGAVYVFRWNGSNWLEEQKLTASDSSTGDDFGFSMDLSGDVLLVGANNKNNMTGAAYVFRWNGSIWVEEHKLTASDGAMDDEFGFSVSIDGDVALVGSLHQGSAPPGSAYIFRWNGTSWVEEQKLNASDGRADDRFGISVSIRDDVALVGACGYDDTGSFFVGGAYIFNWNGSGYVEEKKLTTSDGTGRYEFGRRVTMSGDFTMVSAYKENGIGAVYVFSEDTIPPSGNIIINNGDSQTPERNVTIALNSLDAVYMSFSNDNISYSSWETYSDTKTWTLSEGDGTKTVFTKLKDEAGNISTISANIILDTTAPSGVIAIDDGDSYSMTRDVPLTLDSDDAEHMKFSNDGVSYSDWEPYAVSKDWVLSAGDGVKSVYVKLKDAVGNVATYSDTIILDSTPPTGNMIVNNEDEYSTEKEVSISLTTDNAAYVCFSSDGTNYSDWESYTDSKTWALSGDDGSKTVYVKYKDEAGNTFVISQNIILDSTAPNAPVLNDLGIIDNNQPTFDWDIVSDADHYVLEFADNPDFQISELVDAIGPSEYELNSPLKDGIWYWRVFAVDLAGNESEWSITGKFTIDTTDHCYYGPEKPILQSPSNGAIDVSLTPVLTIQKLMQTPVCNYPLKTRWRISKDADFKGLIAKVNSESKDLDSYKISELMLEPNTTYYWKVRFLGSQGNNSKWSNVFSFTTQPADGDDGDDDGIIDEQKVDDTDDLDNDGTPDNEQKIEIKSFRSKKGDLKFGMRSGNSDIVCAKALHTESVDDDGNKPGQVPYGLMSYRVKVPQYGAKATIKIFLSKPAPKNAKWVFYDSLNGWLDFSDHAVFNKSRTEITVEIKDGGYGDNDHTENKIIVDPSGIGIFDSGSSDAVGGGGSGGSCFISTIVPW